MITKKVEQNEVPRYGAKVEFCGNVANEPTMSFSGGGLQITELTVAIDPPKNRKNVEQTTWMRSVCFGDLAQYVNDNVKVGDTVAGVARLRVDKVKKDGITKMYPKQMISKLYHRAKGSKQYNEIVSEEDAGGDSVEDAG